MKRTAWLAGVVSVLMPLGALASTQARVAAAEEETTSHTLTVSGSGVAMYPAFDPEVSRYGVTTTDATAGSVTVTAASSDPAARFYVDGRPAAGGTATVTGLHEGDEISVFVVDTDTTSRYSLVYLPAGFPTLQRVTPAPEDGASADVTSGDVLLDLSNDWFSSPPHFFDTAVDVNGVPAWVTTAPAGRSIDLRTQPDGHYSVARPTTTPGRTGDAIVELDDRFREVGRRQTVGLTNTDGHESILLPDGTAWLMAYEPNPDTHLIDSIIQRVDPDGTVGFQWTSAPYAGDTVTASPDYAHLNSFELMPNGDLLASFRNLSAVFEIATHPHDGFATGDVVWKLGGRDSSFVIRDADGRLDGGPCAQHSARMLPNGDIVLFDDGSSSYFENLCLDPTDHQGPTVQRPRTRVLEFRIDPDAATATIVRDVAPDGRFAWFAGSTQPLADGHLLVGWAAATQAVATEVDAAGDPVWELVDPNPTTADRYFSYRATKAEVPDATPPQVDVDVPAPHATYVEDSQVTPSYGCTDRGGSSLQTCTGAPTLDTESPGPHVYTVTATDGAGLRTTVSRAYVVVPTAQPDAQVRVQGRAGFVGVGIHGPRSHHTEVARLARAGQRTALMVRIVNDGANADRIRYTVRGHSARFRVTTPHGSHTSPRLAPGASWTFRVLVTRRLRAHPGDQITLRVLASSLSDPSRGDQVQAQVRAVR